MKSLLKYALSISMLSGLISAVDARAAAEESHEWLPGEEFSSEFLQNVNSISFFNNTHYTLMYLSIDSSNRSYEEWLTLQSGIESKIEPNSMERISFLNGFPPYKVSFQIVAPQTHDFVHFSVPNITPTTEFRLTENPESHNLELWYRDITESGQPRAEAFTLMGAQQQRLGAQAKLSPDIYKQIAEPLISQQWQKASPLKK